MTLSACRPASFRAVVLVATLIVASSLSVSVASAGPITCTGSSEGGFGTDDPLFPGSAERCQSIGLSYDEIYSNSNTYSFDFGLITNTLTFDDVLQNMTVFMSAFFVVPGNPVFSARIPDAYEPEVFLTADGPRWVYFRVEDLQDGSDAPPQQGIHFEDNWVQDIVWFGMGPYVDPQVLHDRRPLEVFSDVITVDGSFDSETKPEVGCEGEFCDPAIGGTARDFSDTTVVDVAAAPEPSTLALLATGLGLLYRRRQRLAARRAASF